MVALAASGGNIDLLAEQVKRFRPAYVALARTERAADLERELAAVGVGAPRLVAGPAPAADPAPWARDLRRRAITGAAGPGRAGGAAGRAGGRGVRVRQLVAGHGRLEDRAVGPPLIRQRRQRLDDDAVGVDEVVTAGRGAPP